jgi:psiF repeat
MATRLVVTGLALSLYAASALAAGPTCSDQASDKKLAGAALKSFMTKCEKDAKTSCDAAALEKKLSGAAKTSFTNKCVKDATGH